MCGTKDGSRELRIYKRDGAGYIVFHLECDEQSEECFDSLVHLTKGGHAKAAGDVCIRNEGQVTDVAIRLKVQSDARRHDVYEDSTLIKCDQCGKRCQWDKMIYVPAIEGCHEGFFVCSEECKEQIKGKP